MLSVRRQRERLHSTVLFCDYAPEPRVRKHHGEQTNRRPHFPELGRESVIGIDLAESLVTNAPASGGILRARPSNRHVWKGGGV